MNIRTVNRIINQAFKDLHFDETRHLYTVNGKRLPSVTGLVEDHCDPFDEAKWLPICAVKEKMTEHELKHQWQTINQLACELGTETHNFLENFTGLETPTTPQQVAGVKFLKDFSVDYNILFRELRGFSKKYWFAGTMDLPLIGKFNDKIVIADYKTNGDLFKTFGMLRPPFNYLENHPFSKYQLQLSYYQIILEEIGIPISERILVYLKADATYKIYPCHNFTSDLKKYMDSKQHNVAA